MLNLNSLIQHLHYLLYFLPFLIPFILKLVENENVQLTSISDDISNTGSKSDFILKQDTQPCLTHY